MRRRLFENDYFLSICSKASVMLFGFISVIFLNRYLGAELKGEYSSLLNYVTIISAILQLGVSSIYPKFKRKNIKDCHDIFISLAFLQAAIYLVISFIVIAVSGFSKIAIAICLVSVIAIFTAQLRYINMVDDMKQNAIIVFIMSLVNCAITIFSFMLMEKSVAVALAIYIIKDLTVVFLYGIKINYSNLFKKQYRRIYISILKEGFLPMLASLLVILNYKIDLVMLNLYSIDYAAIGVYSLGLSISEYLWVIPDVFKDVIQKRTAKNNAISSINFSLRCSSILLLIAAIILFILNKQFFVLLFGADFAESFDITMILLIGVYAMVFYKIIGQLFISDGKSKQYFLILLFGAIVNVVINSLAIPFYGIYGAVVASVLSYGIIGVIFLLFYCKSYSVRFKDIFIARKKDFIKIKGLIKKKTDYPFPYDDM